MEKNMAILMADLSGYTALTETHGAVSAADTVDRYLQIVSNSLLGDCKIQERTGDEVMIISSSPDFLLSTAIMILQHTSGEENFLQVHGGLHYGRVLQRNNSYFGAAINLTARIASEAGAGLFWCSEKFISGLTGTSTVEFESKGKHSFKNVNEETAIFEVKNGLVNSYVIDPVCRMMILDKSVAVQHPEHNDHFFCSQDCFDIFKKKQLVNHRHN